MSANLPPVQQESRTPVRLHWNILAVLVARGLDLVSSLVSVIVLTRYLGVESFAEYTFLSAVVFTVTALAHLGLPKILVREMSQDPKSVAKLLGSGLVLSGGMIVVVGPLAAISAVLLGMRGAILAALPVAIAAEMLQVFTNSFMSVCIARSRMDFDALITFAGRTLYLVALGVLVSCRLPLPMLFVFMLGGNAVTLLVAEFLCRKKLSVSPRFGNWRFSVWHLGAQALPVGISFLLLRFYLYVDVLVLRVVSDMREVALFQAPYAFLSKAHLISHVFVIALSPVFARLALAGGRESVLVPVFSRISKFVVLASLPVLAIGICYAQQIVTLLFGGDFVGATPVFMILICGLPMVLMEPFGDLVLVSAGKQRLALAAIVAGLLVNLGLNIFLGYYFGAPGAAVGALIGQFVVAGTQLIFIHRVIGRIPWTQTFLYPASLLVLVVATAYSLAPSGAALALGLALALCGGGLAIRGRMLIREARGMLDVLKHA